MKLMICFLLLSLSVNAVHAKEVTKTVYAKFTGDLKSNNLVAIDETVMTQPCSNSAQGDCYFLLGGKKINGFALGGYDGYDVSAISGVLNSVSAAFDTTPRSVVLINANGKTTNAYFRIIGIGFQINAPYLGGFAYSFDRVFMFPEGGAWPGTTNLALSAGGDCSSIGTFHYSYPGRAFRTFWVANKSVGRVNCFATNAVWSNLPNAKLAYEGIGPYFLYEITTDSVTRLEPGLYESITPIKYSVGSGKDIEPFSGVYRNPEWPNSYGPVPDMVSVNVKLNVEHAVYVSGMVSKLKLYPGTTLSWERWKQIRTPLKNDLHFRFASTGPVRVSVVCKDAYTQEGDCALLRRLPSSSIEPGAVDGTDSTKYGISIKLNLPGFVNYYTKETIQNYLLKPSTSPIGSMPSSSLTIEPLTTETQPATFDISTLPDVSRLLEAGRTYAGTVTFIIEPGTI